MDNIANQRGIDILSFLLLLATVSLFNNKAPN